MAVVGVCLAAEMRSEEYSLEKKETGKVENAQPLSDQEIVQKLFEGVFSENKLDGPYMVKYCFTADIAHKTVVFLGDFLDKAAKGSAKDLVSLIGDVKAFYESLPWSFIECLGKCQQIRSLGFKYDIDGGTDMNKLQIKITEYILLHFLQVHKWSGDLNGKWLGQYYFDVGYFGAIDAHKIQYWSVSSLE